MREPWKDVDIVIKLFWAFAVIAFILMFYRVAYAGVEFVNRYDKEIYSYEQQMNLLEQSRTQAELKAVMAMIRDRIAVEKDMQFKEALRVLEDAMDESKLFEIYARRKEIAEESRKTLDELREKFGSVGGIMYMGSEVIYANK